MTSAAAQYLLDVIATVNVKRNFLANGAATFCNLAASVICALMGARLPILLTANGQSSWLSSSQGSAEGWKPIPKEEALVAANLGRVVVAIAEAIPHGHVGVCVPSLPGKELELCVCAAGRENWLRTPIKNSFGKLQPTFYLHSKESTWLQSLHS